MPGGRSLDYRQFGEAFVLQAVTPERVVAMVSRIAGATVALGPIRAGPGGRATVNATGRIGEPSADEEGADPLVYAVRLPIDVDLEVKVGTVNRYAATGIVDLRLTVRAVAPLALHIDVDPVRPEHINFHIRAHGVQARLLGRAGDVDGELRRHAAEYVNGRLSDPDTSRFSRIDLVPIMERVWSDL